MKSSRTFTDIPKGLGIGSKGSKPEKVKETAYKSDTSGMKGSKMGSKSSSKSGMGHSKREMGGY